MNFNFIEIERDYLDKTVNQDQAKNIQIMRSTFKMTFVPGTADFIEFLQIIKSCKNPIFILSELRHFIDYKFFHMIYYIYAFNFMNVLFFLYSYAFGMFIPITQNSLICYLFTCVLFLLIEFIQIFSDAENYFL
jgi:hypothetical protein